MVFQLSFNLCMVGLIKQFQQNEKGSFCHVVIFAWAFEKNCGASFWDMRDACHNLDSMVAVVTAIHSSFSYRILPVLNVVLIFEPRTCGGEERLGRTAPEDPEGSAAAERGRLLRQ